MKGKQTCYYFVEEDTFPYSPVESQTDNNTNNNHKNDHFVRSCSSFISWDMFVRPSVRPSIHCGNLGCTVCLKVFIFS